MLHLQRLEPLAAAVVVIAAAAIAVVATVAVESAAVAIAAVAIAAVESTVVAVVIFVPPQIPSFSQLLRVLRVPRELCAHLLLVLYEQPLHHSLHLAAAAVVVVVAAAAAAAAAVVVEYEALFVGFAADVAFVLENCQQRKKKKRKCSLSLRLIFVSSRL